MRRASGLVPALLLGACELLASIPNAGNLSGDGDVDPGDALDGDGAFVGECADSAECPDPAEPVCELPRGECRPCIADAECPTNVCLSDGTCASDARFIYAAPAGVGTECSQAAACSLDTAVGLLSAEKDIVKLAPGIYERGDALMVTTSGTIAGPGATIRIIDTAADYAINATTGSALTLHGMTIDAGSPSSSNGVAVCSGGTSLTLFRVTATGGAVGVFSSNCPLTVRDSTLTNTNAYALFVTMTSVDIANTFIVNNVLNTAYAGAAAILSNATGQVVHSTLAYNTPAAAGALSCANSTVTVKNIIATQNTADGIAPTCTVSNSIVDAQFAGPGENNLAADPLFLDAANRNYHIQPTSPARGIGDPAIVVPRDVDGELRPWPAGSAPDVGADETP